MFKRTFLLSGEILLKSNRPKLTFLYLKVPTFDVLATNLVKYHPVNSTRRYLKPELRKTRRVNIVNTCKRVSTGL